MEAGASGVIKPPASRPSEAPPQHGPLRGNSIVDFLTDGSLPALCEELGRLAGVPIVVSDPLGRRILPAPPPENWTLAPAAPGPAAFVTPIIVGEREIGRLSVPTMLDGGQRRHLERLLQLLASTVTEVCSHEVELRHRLREISVLYRLSALLAKAENLDAVLHTGLDSALEVLGLDAGSIVLFEEGADGQLSVDERDLALKASRSLSREWLGSPTPLSIDRVFDRMALRGEIVTVRDLRTDPRVQIREMVVAEGLCSAIHAGLVFQDQPVGVMRLYSRSPRDFAPEDQRLVRSIGQQLAVGVQQARLMKMQAEDRRIQRQLALASDVQRRMLPRTIPTIPSLELAASWMPSLELSGDFYDVIPPASPGGRFGIVVGDVVGKGIAAALLMALARGSLRAHCSEEAGIGEVLARVNRDLCRDMLEGEFVTLWLGMFDPASRRLEYGSAGHEPGLLVRRQGGVITVTELTCGGPLLGVERAWSFPPSEEILQPGDLVIVHTDGLVDATNFDGERYGRERARRAARLAMESASSAAEALGVILREVRQFSGLATRPDDQTIVVMRVRD